MIMIILHILAALFFWPALFITIPMHILININRSNVTAKEKKHSSFVENEDKFKISFHAKNDSSWINIKSKLFAFYEQKNIKNIISDKDKTWMLGGNENMKGYVQATIDNNIITIESFKLPKPDISIIKSETKEKYEEKNDSTDRLIELGKLLEKELITKEEFEIEKKKILFN